MKNLIKYTPKVEKRTLLLIAGIVWGFAGFRVLTSGLGDVKINNGNWIISIASGSIVFYMIINSSLEKHCVFSFFDFKSYFIMSFMIFLGITVRNIGVFNPVYVGDFYMGLGLALFMAGVLFLLSSIKFTDTKLKYSN